MAKKKDSAQELVNIQAAQAAAQVANWAAQLEFQKERLRILELPQMQAQNEIQRAQNTIQADELAWKKAESEYKKALEEATLTGTYKGVPTVQWLEQQARLTGVLNGQQTLEGKLTDQQIAQMQHAMEIQSRTLQLDYEKFGFDRTRWQSEFEYGKQNDLRNFLLSEAGITGSYNGQATLDKQRLDSQNALSYLQLLATVQNNPFKMLRVQQNGGSFNDLASGFLNGQQVAASGGITGNPGATSVGDMLTQYLPNGQVAPLGTVAPQMGVAGAQGVAATMPYTYIPQAAPTGATGATVPYNYAPPGAQAPVQAYNYQPTPSGQTQVYPPGIPAPANQEQVSTSVPQSSAAQGALGSEALDRYVPGSGGTLTPNKISGEGYANANAGKKKLLWQYLDDQGWDEETAQDIFQKSLPKYAGPSRGSVRKVA